MNGVSLNRLARRRLTDPRLKEGIREPLYDSLTYNSGATTELPFFQDPKAAGKTLLQTNMKLNGQLPSGHKYIAETLEIHIKPGSNASSYVRQDPVKTGTALAAPNFANDVYALMTAGYLVLSIGEKPYLTAPLIEFPSTKGLLITPAAAVENTNTAVVNQITVDYARWVGKPFFFNPTLPLEPQTNFDVSLFWPTAVTLPSGFDAEIVVEFGGVRIRK